MKKKSCGSCAYYCSLGSMVNKSYKGKGICEYYDAGWARTDGGRDCPHWVGLKYNGKSERRKAKKEIDVEILKWE